MSYRQLNYEEANKLCEQALILICQQNLAKKQQSQKNKNSPFITPLEVPLSSPPKASFKEPKLQVLESPNISHCVDFQKSPLKKIMLTPHKLSIDKQSTFMELLDLSQQAQFKLAEKQDSCLDLASRAGNLSQKEIRMQTSISIESSQKLSQMLVEVQEKLLTQNEVKDLKRELQIQSRGKLCKTQNLDSQTGQIIGYHFLCKNDSECPFNCFLEYFGKRTTKGERIYRLISQNETHLKACIQEEEELNFMKLTKLIDSMQDSIRKLLSQDGQLKPKDVLTRIAEGLGEIDHTFIYKGLSSKNYHKAAKKYFDNLIYKVKNPNWANS